jgi:UDP-N-acetylglucosamine diphosphorylase/glucosamine-1-phosphate N-acetyltransferase
MQRNRLAAVILAAGKGTRMKSQGAKVLQPLSGRPILSYPIETIQSLTPDRLIVVVGYQAEEVVAKFQSQAVEFVVQEPQLGTGHAVRQAEAALAGFMGDVLILCGDMPLLRPETLKELVGQHQKNRAHCSLLTLKTHENKDFGRILRDEQGAVVRIVEHRDATPAEKTIDEYSAGVYCLDKELLFKALAEIDNDNIQKEYYLTDIIRYLVKNRLKVHAVQTADADEVFGINTEDDLRKAEKILQERRS